ncbi:BlaI family penicillinase repressor [Clostridium tetanomorphum]|uniref:BlaI/MecI/CopY family transcriptional regulator n=1 Tax=Clostridium tetanomorphum TaxID=1553 RepID=A0A923E854_CLOTT|nr:BlaI/MecI/CopY family transcriptional regulator [Clostridium tetanomorphum]KAJ52783.1 CopY family transcriptional regulator [Clostridium tetanomorphum DSM 665]MBC2396466.1 BlaI/MecI/CopY family transcriptional regulator [Clostridium tetanomorphum]MBP1865366.1 BlaI family penicillinase repressor [Clostridium tetanomorphum]NRS84867.1 BlaI family penicillinase repressor [Clostridium tetanomorphum]NRZ98084.1 BlaI family penicillinase repressor [Clostridium tetanomorphum]
MSKYNISESEWKVMTCLWKEPNLTLKQISQNLKDTKWSYSTIRTLVTRLMEKGAIDADKSSSSNFKYFPIVQEKECKVQETKNFLTRVFNGSVSMMISTLAKQEELSPKEVAELKEIIESMDGGE